MPRHIRFPVKRAPARAQTGGTLAFPERVIDQWLPKPAHRDHVGRGELVLAWVMTRRDGE